MCPAFHFSRSEHTAHFRAACGTVAKAKRLLRSLPQTMGTPFEREGDIIYTEIPLGLLDDALLNIELSGYPTIDADADEWPV